MSNRHIRTAIAREKRAAARSGQSVLRRERDLKAIKVKARKAKTHIKIVLGGDGLALEQRRMSMEEFRRRAAKANHELRMMDEALAKIGLRNGDGQRNAGGERPLTAAPASQDATPKPKRKIVRFWVAPPEEFRRRLRPELGLKYDPESIYWCGDVDAAKVESFIRRNGQWDLVRFFNGAVSSP